MILCKCIVCMFLRSIEKSAWVKEQAEECNALAKAQKEMKYECRETLWNVKQRTGMHTYTNTTTTG